jgi:hypothetical protein
VSAAAADAAATACPQQRIANALPIHFSTNAPRDPNPEPNVQCIGASHCPKQLLALRSGMRALCLHHFNSQRQAIRPERVIVTRIPSLIAA